MDSLLPILAQYGIVGVVLGGCGWYVVQHDQSCNAAHKEMQERHTQERKELTDAMQRQHSEAIAQSDKFATALDSNTRILATLETIIAAK